MKTLQLFSAKPETIPVSAVWHVADLAEARGRQELYMRQVPQHDTWPYINYLLFILKTAYREFESRLDITKNK